MNFNSKNNILNKIHDDEAEYIRKIIEDIEQLNQIENDAPVFEKELGRKNKFGENNVYFIDRANDMKFGPDNATIKVWGEKAQYRASGAYARKLGPKKAYSMHLYIWMMTRGTNPPKGWEIHHKDGNHFNNSPENLVCVPKSIHILLDMRSKEIKRTRVLTEAEEGVVDKIYNMSM